VYEQSKFRDLVCISDVWDAVLGSTAGLDGEQINIGSGTGTSATGVANMVVTEIPASSECGVSVACSGDLHRYVADLSKAATLLDFDLSVANQEMVAGEDILVSRGSRPACKIHDRPRVESSGEYGTAGINQMRVLNMTSV